MEELVQRKQSKSGTDILGKPIDDGIKEMVITLNILGFQTLRSCEGHLKKGYPYPWVCMIPTNIDGVASPEKMIQLLDSFSEVRPQHKLGIIIRGTEGNFVLQCKKDLSLEETKRIPISLRRRMLSSTREDMNAFCDFLGVS